MTFHHIINKSQSTPFSAQRTISDTGKVRITVEAVALKDSHNSLILHLTILNDGLKDDFTVSIHILKTIPSNRFQELGYREHGTRIEPTRHMIPADMI